MSTATQPLVTPINLPANPERVRPPRLDSVDLLRGLAMAVMAIDHTRDFFTWRMWPPEALQHTYAALFFTRWITHFCAPIFFFLAGTGAYLSLSNGKSMAQVSTFLWKRGLWLIVLEETVISVGWTGVPFPGVIGLVIWALGWSMIVLAALVRLPVKAIAVIGLSIIALHNLLDPILADHSGTWVAALWSFLHVQRFTPIATIPGIPVPLAMLVLYPLIPWIGVMAVGYAFGSVLRRPPDERRRITFLDRMLRHPALHCAAGFSSLRKLPHQRRIDRQQWRIPAASDVRAFRDLIPEYPEISAIVAISAYDSGARVDAAGVDGTMEDAVSHRKALEQGAGIWPGADVLLHPAYLLDPHTGYSDRDSHRPAVEIPLVGRILREGIPAGIWSQSAFYLCRLVQRPGDLVLSLQMVCGIQAA